MPLDLVTPVLSSVFNAERRRLHLRRWGVGEKSCLLLHGYGDAGHIWHHFATNYISSHRLYAIDFRGHGDSDWSPDGCYRSEDLVAEVLLVIEKLISGPVVIVGHSLGAEIALEVARTLGPNKVPAVVVVDFGPDSPDEVELQIVNNLRKYLRPFVTVEEFVDLLATDRPLVDRQLLRYFARESLRFSDRGGFTLKLDPALLDRVHSDFDSWQLFADVSVPICLVRGLGSAVLSRSVAQRLAERFPNIELVCVVRSGHGVLLDNPAGFLAATAPFLARTYNNW